jgi:hypothetical protein
MNTVALAYDHGMKTRSIIAFTLVAAGLVLAACNTSGLGEKPRAKFAHLACLDLNDDGRISSADAEHVEDIADFNADGERDENDAAFVDGVDIPLIPDARQTCEDRSDDNPDYLVAHEFLRDADVSCGPGDRAMLVLGVAGGVDDLKDDDQAAGVRQTVNATLRRLEGQDIQTIAVIAGSALYGAENAHTGMEDWLTNAMRVYFERFPCVRLTTIGFSHGGVTVAVIASRLEAEYGDRMVATVVLDRIESFYSGDLTSMPVASPLINVYQTNTPGGFRVDAPNVFNFDASGEQGPPDDEHVGTPQPVTHVTLDNSPGVRDVVTQMIVERATGPSAAAP